MAQTATKDSKYNVQYEEDIITIETTFENSIDISQVPVIPVNNVEVMFSSLTAKTPKFGHSITFLVTPEFVSMDEKLCEHFQKAIKVNDASCRFLKSQIKTIIGQKEVLDGSYPEKYVGYGVLQINTSNSTIFDTDSEENKSIQKYEDAVNGNITTKYFRVIDAFTGKGIDPEIFEIKNGQKVTTFTHNGVEKPLYVSKDDLVNVQLRPYFTQNRKDKSYSLKYNLLTIERVQTAFDRGLGKKGTGGKKHVEAAPNVAGLEGLGDLVGMFGSGSVVSTPKSETKKSAPASKKAEEKVVTVESVTGVPGSAPEVTETPVQTPTENNTQFDFNQLGKDLANFNLGG